MLVANNEKKQAILLFQLLQHLQLHEIKSQSFYCPQCGKSVIVKAGSIKIPHFAHKQKTACDGHFSERESMMHLTGKQQLFTWLQEKHVNVQLEATIPQLLQRPDLLATIQNRQFAIEFQCSPINDQLFYERTAGYRSVGIEPVWILKNMIKMTRQMPIEALKLTYFQRLFIQCSWKTPFIVCYDTDAQQFIYYHHLFFIRTNQCVAVISALPLTAQRLPLLKPSTISKDTFKQLFGLFRNRQQAYITASYTYGQAKVHDLLWRSMYELRILYNQIPFTVGLPILNSEIVCESTLKWQVGLHYYAQLYKIHLSDMKLLDVQQFLRWAKFNTSSAAENAVLQYLQICRQSHIETVHSTISIPQLINCIYNQFVAISVKN